MPAISHHRALERFEILEELSPERGETVLLCRSRAKSLVVVRVIADTAIPDDVASALSHEAAIAARLDHEAILKLRALLLEPDFAALVTEFVPGVSLQRLLRFASGRGVRLPDTAGWYVVERVFSALAFAHAQKDSAGNAAPVAHRSVSPASVVVAWDGTAKIGDFGASRVRALGASVTGRKDVDLGALVAPEQARGGQATPLSDVFAAALVALRVATGRTPYARFRTTAERMIAMAEGTVSSLSKTRPDLPKPLVEAIDRALVADQTARTIAAADLAEVVRAHFDLTAGKEALATLLGRWQEPLTRSVSPWEKRASVHDLAAVLEAQALSTEADPALALTLADERPSSDGVTPREPDEPWKKKAVPKEEEALAPTDAATSLSRLGSVAPEAFSMPALPPARMATPSLPTYAGPPAPRLPAPKKGFSGGVAAATIFVGFALMIAATVFLFRWLMAPPPDNRPREVGALVPPPSPLDALRSSSPLHERRSDG